MSRRHLAARIRKARSSGPNPERGVPPAGLASPSHSADGEPGTGWALRITQPVKGFSSQPRRQLLPDGRAEDPDSPARDRECGGRPAPGQAAGQAGGLAEEGTLALKDPEPGCLAHPSGLSPPFTGAGFRKADGEARGSRPQTPSALAAGVGRSPGPVFPGQCGALKSPVSWFLLLLIH